MFLIKRAFAIKLFFLFSIAAAFFGCSSEQQIISNWTTSQIKIDGDDSDWEGSFTYYADYNAAVGFKNDDKSLYICLKTNDPMKVIPLFRRGFTIWLEPEKDDSKTIGVKFPFFDKGMQEDATANNGRQPFSPENAGDFINKMIESQKEIQLINKAKFPLTLLPLENNEGIKAALSYNNTQFVYELQVPLKDNKYQYLVAAEPGEKINVKFETAEMDRNAMPGGGMGGGGRRRGGGMGGDGGGMGGMGGGPPRNPGMNRENFKPINFSVELTLQKQK